MKENKENVKEKSLVDFLYNDMLENRLEYQPDWEDYEQVPPMTWETICKKVKERILDFERN